MIGEFVGSDDGLGNLLLVANSQLNTALAFAALVALAILGMGLYAAVAGVELSVGSMAWRRPPWLTRMVPTTIQRR